MWLTLAALSACTLGVYDAAKKQALKRNGSLWVLLVATALSSLFLSPFLSIGSFDDHIKLVFKAFLVSASWISGMVGLLHLPLTTASTIKGSRPMFVVLFSVILFSERLSVLQWVGICMVLIALWMLGGTSRKEGSNVKGLVAMGISVVTGVASALYDKRIMTGMEPLFVQSWANIYITVIIAVCVLVKSLKDGPARERFKWDWWILLIAVLITVSDFLYFTSLKQPGALLSIISTVRRGSIVISFILGAIFFGEKHLKEKAVEMAILLSGVTLLMFTA